MGDVAFNGMAMPGMGGMGGMGRRERGVAMFAAPAAAAMVPEGVVIQKYKAVDDV